MNDPAVLDSVPAVNDALEHWRCPDCEYDLHGLPTLRCPECGQTYSREQLQRTHERLAFESATGWRRIPAFFITCFNVLVRPWVFARRVTAGYSFRHGAAFGLICFAGTLVTRATLVTGWAFFVVWWSAALACIVAQSVILATLDRQSWIVSDRHWGHSFLFWLVVGGYTSAVMLTEVVYGPPELALSSFLERDAMRSLFFEFQDARLFVFRLQILSWTVALTIVFVARQRGANKTILFWIRSLVVWLLLWCIYGAAVEYVGLPMHQWLIPIRW